MLSLTSFRCPFRLMRRCFLGIIQIYNILWCKVDVNVSDSVTIIRTLDIKIVHIAMDASNDFWIMNAMCTFLYLFVVYFSFAPVISARIHRYVNYFYIQVLKMVTETETLTSTLHHHKFTYLDYYVFFSCYLHTVWFYPYLLSYCFFGKKQIPNTILHNI